MESASPMKLAAPVPPDGSRRMQMRYGFNEVDAWWHIALGEHREEIRRRLRLMGTEVMRIFMFDKPVPDPMTQWCNYAAYIQAVLDAGARPMVTFAKFCPPHDDPRNLRTFVARCTEIVWGCIEQWGGEAVSDWLWCVWNEPNNLPVGGGLTFPQYRHIYEEVAGAICRLLEPYLAGRKARIGGPAVDGFQPYWLDWISRLVNEVDDALLGFVSWHRYGDWRPAVPSGIVGMDLLGSPEAPSNVQYETLLMAQTPDYEARARGVARVLVGRDILNVCGELNTIVNHDYTFVGGLNQNAFGAAYYSSALIHLIRGGADLEMRWVATANDDAYGLMTMKGEPTPACLGKQLFAQYVRYGDWVRFPYYRPEAPNLDAVVAWAENGRRSAVFVNTSRGPLEVKPSDEDASLSVCDFVLRLDMSTGDRVVRELYNGTVRLDGYGLAVVTNTADADVD